MVTHVTTTNKLTRREMTCNPKKTRPSEKKRAKAEAAAAAAAANVSASQDETLDDDQEEPTRVETAAQVKRRMAHEASLAAAAAACERIKATKKSKKGSSAAKSAVLADSSSAMVLKHGGGLIVEEEDDVPPGEVKTGVRGWDEGEEDRDIKAMGDDDGDELGGAPEWYPDDVDLFVQTTYEEPRREGRKKKRKDVEEEEIQLVNGQLPIEEAVIPGRLKGTKGGRRMSNKHRGGSSIEDEEDFDWGGPQEDDEDEIDSSRRKSKKWERTGERASSAPPHARTGAERDTRQGRGGRANGMGRDGRGNAVDPRGRGGGRGSGGGSGPLRQHRWHMPDKNSGGGARGTVNGLRVGGGATSTSRVGAGARAGAFAFPPRGRETRRADLDVDGAGAGGGTRFEPNRRQRMHAKNASPSSRFGTGRQWASRQNDDVPRGFKSRFSPDADAGSRVGSSRSRSGNPIPDRRE